ncbi:ABC transporter permease subunit [Bosea vestrisii]|uniref:ABC transporter permease subunit n=1 Tax=Bosea vestrisii TaxID=151416 RepID=UPI003D766B42
MNRYCWRGPSSSSSPRRPSRSPWRGLGFSAATCLILYLARSSYGRAWRAVADDARTASLFGIDPRAVHDRALIIACAICGAAGVIVTVIYGGMGFSGGFTLGLKALVAAVLGGIGSVPGACLGAS